jgi:hypothetical protein
MRSWRRTFLTGTAAAAVATATCSDGFGSAFS